MEKTDSELKLQWEQEEIEKKKKEKAALKYFTAAVSDIVKNKQLISNLAKINDSGLFKEMPAQKSKELRKAGVYAASLIEHSYVFLKKKKEFFKLDPADEDQKDIRESLTQLNLPDEEYGTLYMCAAGDKMKDICDQMMGRSQFDQTDSKENAIKQLRIKSIRQALGMYRKGNRKAMAELLKVGLKHACQHFANTRNDEEAMELSGITSEILYVCNQDPSLAKAGGITEEQLKIAKEVANLGNDMQTGLMAVNVLISAEVDNKVSLLPNQRQGLMEMALKMKTAIAQKQEMAKKWLALEKTKDNPQVAAPQLSLS